MSEHQRGQEGCGTGRVLDDYVTWQSGGTPSKANPSYWAGNIPWVTPKDMKWFDLKTTTDYLTEAGVAAGSKLAPQSATYIVVRGMILAHTFPVSQMSTPAAFNQDVKAVNPGPELIPRYLAYWFKAHASDFLRLVGESTHGTKKLDLPDLRVFPMNPPNLAVQARIVEILTAVDEQINSTERIRAKWLNTRTGIVADLTSGHWPIHRLSDLAVHVTSGSRGWARYYAEDGATFIRIGNLTRSHINLRFDSVVRVSVPSRTEGSRTGLKSGDLLISITADLGIVGVVPDDLGESYINQHIALVRIDPAKADPRWLGHYLSSPRGQGQFRRLNDQGAKAGLNLPTIASLEVALPPAGEQARRVAALDGVDRRIGSIDAEIVKLKRLRLGVLVDLFTGRVRVPAEVAS